MMITIGMLLVPRKPSKENSKKCHHEIELSTNLYPNNSSESLTTTTIIGIVLGVFGVVLVIALLVYILPFHKKKDVNSSRESILAPLITKNQI